MAEDTRTAELAAQQWIERAVKAADLNEKGNFECALRDCEDAIRLKPDFAETLHNRGLVRYARGDFEGALRDYDEALRLKSDDTETLVGRGLGLNAKGDLDGALQDYNEALRLKPDFALALSNRDEVRRAIDGKSNTTSLL